MSISDIFGAVRTQFGHDFGHLEVEKTGVCAGGRGNERYERSGTIPF